MANSIILSQRTDIILSCDENKYLQDIDCSAPHRVRISSLGIRFDVIRLDK